MSFDLLLLQKGIPSAPFQNIESIVKSLPADLETAYEQIICRVSPQHQSFAKRQAASSDHCHVRPLTLAEIDIVCAIGVASDPVIRTLAELEDHRLLNNIKLGIESVQGRLVRLTNDRVYLVHSTSRHL